jgi:hypothetical protein
MYGVRRAVSESAQRHLSALPPAKADGRESFFFLGFSPSALADANEAPIQILRGPSASLVGLKPGSTHVPIRQLKLTAMLKGTSSSLSPAKAVDSFG